MRRTGYLFVILVGLLAGLAAGCGQKGPLYLPDEPPADGAQDGR